MIWYGHDAKSQREDAERRPERTVHPYRLPIKLTLDEKARSMDQRKRETTLAELIRLPHHTSENTPRLSPLEDHIWTMEVTVRQIDYEQDGDIVFVFSDGSAQATAEIPQPSLTKTSRFQAQIAAVRSQIESELGPVRKMDLSRRARITGIGFAGMQNSQTPTGVRLYPLLELKWLDSSGNAR